MNPLGLLTEQSRFLLNLRESLEKQNVRVSDNSTYQWERAKMIGMLDMARAIDLDIDDFRWVYSC
jgi:hypothetical protein